MITVSEKDTLRIPFLPLSQCERKYIILITIELEYLLLNKQNLLSEVTYHKLSAILSTITLATMTAFEIQRGSTPGNSCYFELWTFSITKLWLLSLSVFCAGFRNFHMHMSAHEWEFRKKNSFLTITFEYKGIYQLSSPLNVYIFFSVAHTWKEGNNFFLLTDRIQKSLLTARSCMYGNVFGFATISVCVYIYLLHCCSKVEN